MHKIHLYLCIYLLDRLKKKKEKKNWQQLDKEYAA